MEQLTKYLTDAHSIEVQALAQLEKAPEVAKFPPFEQALREHYGETQRHEQLTRTLLEDRDAAPNKLKDMVMGLGGKGFLLFARVQPGSDVKGISTASLLAATLLITAQSFSASCCGWHSFLLFWRSFCVLASKIA